MDIRNENTPLQIVSVYYAIVAPTETEIDTFTDNYDGSVSIVFNSGKDWKKIYGTLDTITFQEPTRDTDAGKQYNQELTLTNPGDVKELIEQLYQLDQKELIIRFDYQKEGSKIMGSPENPAFLNSDFSARSFDAQRSVSFTCNSDQPSKFLE